MKLIRLDSVTNKMSLRTIKSTFQLQQTGRRGLKGEKGDKGNPGDVTESPVQSVNGKIGDVVLVKGDIGLGNVDNTSDTNKPVSLAQAAANIQDRARSNHTGTQLSSTISDFSTSVDARITLQKAQPNGLASLGSDGKLLSGQLPTLPITDTQVFSSQAGMLAWTTADQGDVAVRTDVNKSFILTNNSPTILSSWQELLTPTDAVSSVNGRTGAVTGLAEQSDLAAHVANLGNPHSVTKAQVGLGNADNTSDLAKPISTATQTALNLKANTADLATVAFSGSYNDLLNKPTIPTGDVTAATAFGTDNSLIRSDGTGKGVQSSLVTVDDTGGMMTDGGLGVGIATPTTGINTEGNVRLTNSSASNAVGRAIEFVTSTVLRGSLAVFRDSTGSGANMRFNLSVAGGAPVEVGRILSDGKWGIGTNASNAKLQVNGDVNWNTAGNVPATSYIQVLQASTTAVSTGFQLLAADAANSSMTNGRWGANGNAAANIFYKSRSATVGGVAAVINGDNIGNHTYIGSDGTAAGVEVGRSRVRVEGTVSTGNVPGAYDILTNPGGSLQSTVSLSVHPDSSTAIGYGTVLQSDMLSVNGSSFFAGVTKANGGLKIGTSSVIGQVWTASDVNGNGSWQTLPAGGTGTVTSVAVSGGTTGLTTSGGPITTNGTITLAGTLAVANGGTGSTTQNFVDLTTDQTIGGVKTFTTSPVLSSGLKFAPIAAPTYSQGQLYYDSTEDSLTFMGASSSTMLNVGQEQYVRVTNNTAAIIPNGTPVYITGALTGRATIAPAGNTTAVLSQSVGLTTESIGIGATGYVSVQGLVRGVNTAAFTAGATVYVGATAGSLTSTVPVNPAFITRIGTVTVSDATNGVILLNVEASPLFTAQAATADLATVLANANLRGSGTAWTLTTTGAVSVGTLTAAATTITSLRTAYRTVSTTTTAASTDFTIGADTTTAGFTVTLPTAVGINGRIYNIKKVSTDANTLTIATTSGQTIDGAATLTTTSTTRPSYSLQSNNANWILI